MPGRPSRNRRVRAEHLEQRFMLSGVKFAEHPPIVESELDLPEAVYVADLDNDGDADVLSASRGDDKIAWYENLDGTGTFGPQRVITTQADAAMSVSAADLDGDRDLDALSVSRDDNKIAWYENIDGAGTFGQQRIITTQVDGIRSAQAADLDADGDLDVLYPSAGPNRQVVWFENTNGKGDFGPPNSINTGSASAWAVNAADLDGDSDLDVLVSWGWGERQDRVGWLENIDESDEFGPLKVIGFFGAGDALFAGDADADGDIDVLTGRGWAENVDGKGMFSPHDLYNDYYTSAAEMADLDGDGYLDVLSFPRHRTTINWSHDFPRLGIHETDTLIASGKFVSSIAAGDVDGDGDADVLTANVISDEITWYENLDGKATFGEANILSVSHVAPQIVRAVDVDIDGDLDILAASSGTSKIKITWYENEGGMAMFGMQRLISVDVGNASRSPADVSLCTVDVDHDNDIDIIVSSTFLGDGAVYSHLSWYENVGGFNMFGPRRVISMGVGGSIECVDLDSDGDADVLSAFNYWNDSGYKTNVFWHENTNGAGSFGQPIEIAHSVDSRVVLTSVDLDGDSDLDILVTTIKRGTEGLRGSQIAWHENTDGEATFGGARTIAFSVDGLLSSVAVDINGDGDADILEGHDANGGEALHGSISWHENTNGEGEFGPVQLITSNADSRLSGYPLDLNDDDALDIVTLSYGRRAKVSWQENMDGVGSFGPEVLLSDGGTYYGPQVVDLDGDGDRDMIFVASLWNARDIVWHENTDGLGTFGDRQTLASGRLFDPADLDGDEDIDILIANEHDEIIWLENTTCESIDSGSVVGDVNGDERFDHRDILRVLHAGKYLTGQRATPCEGDNNGDGLFDQLDILAILQNAKSKATVKP